MRRPGTCLIAAILLTLAAAPAAQGVEREWNQYQPGNGVCSIRFPVNPEYQTVALDGMTLHIYLAKDTSRNPAYAYTVSFGDYPKDRFVEKDAQKKILDSDRDAFVRAVNGKVMSEKSTPLAEYPGRAVTISGEDGQARYLLRMYLVGTRIFHLSVCVPAAQIDDPDVGKFFESFQLSRK